MTTKIIGAMDRFVNVFFANGRLKNQIYKELRSVGMNEIREREIAKDKFVLMASKVKGAGKSNMTIGADLNSGYVQKETLRTHVLSPFGLEKASLIKTYLDIANNFKSQIVKNLTLINGKSVSCEQIETVSGKYVKTTNKSCTDSSRSVKIMYENGNRYNYEEKADGTKTYNRIIDGVEYTFIPDKKTAK